MKVVHLNTFPEGGGAAIAARRIVYALGKEFSESEFKIISTADYRSVIWKILLFIEKAILYPFLKNRKEIFNFSWSFIGLPLIKNKQILDADILHIHWFNQAFLSNHGFEKLINTGKPIIITMHDMWLFTGGCHYNEGCQNYLGHCKLCPYLRNSFISFRQQSFHSKIMSAGNVKIVSCSNWLKEEAKRSTVMKSKEISVIPNPIKDSHNTVDAQKENSIDFGLPSSTFVILFVSANLNDKRKGLHDLLNALELLKNKNYHLLLVGKNSDQVIIPDYTKVTCLGFVEDEKQMNNIYFSSDLFCCPSIQDNLPNTVMESLNNGTPVISFDTGGLSDLIVHGENGYLIRREKERVNGLCEGIRWMIQNQKNFDRTELSRNFREKFSASRISHMYMNIYRDSLNEKG